jgi:aldehyde dehydrogenase (NAD+)
VVEGVLEVSKLLMDLPFDYIFFTGGVEAGKEVMKKASERLTPLTLELGGKYTEKFMKNREKAE